MFSIICWQASIERKVCKIDSYEAMETSQDIESTTSEDSGSPQKDGSDINAEKDLMTNIKTTLKDVTTEQDDENNYNCNN